MPLDMVLCIFWTGVSNKKKETIIEKGLAKLTQGQGCQFHLVRLSLDDLPGSNTEGLSLTLGYLISHSPPTDRMKGCMGPLK